MLIAWSRRRAWALLAVAGVVTAAAASQLVDLRSGELRLRVDPSLEPLVTPDTADGAAHDEVRRRFGSDETVLVAMRTGDAFALENLRRLDRLTRALFALPGVATVTSLTTVPLAKQEDGELSLQRLRAEDLVDPGLPGRLRSEVQRNPLLRGHLVSADGAAAAIVLSLEPGAEARAMTLAAQIQDVADAELAEGVEVWVTGAPIVRAATSQAVLDELRWIIPVLVVMLAAFLAVAFRSWRGVLLPMATIALALTWTFGLLCFLDRPLNLITSLVPPLLVTMGIAYCAHVLSEFEAIARGPAAAPAERIVLLLREVGPPVLLTGLTTSVGLLALAINDLPAIREFAWLSATGVALTVVLVLTFLPAALLLAARGEARRALPGQDLFERGGKRLGEFDTRWRSMILMVAGVVFLGALAFSSRIQVGDQFVGVFEADVRVRSDFEAVSAAFGGVTPLAISLDGLAADTFAQPENLRRLKELQGWIAGQPEVGAVTGLVDHVRLHSELFGVPAEDGIPPTRQAIRQLLFFGDSEALRGVVNGDLSATLLRVRLRVDETTAIAAFLDRLDTKLDALPAHWRVRATGQAVLLTRSVETVTTGQMQSIALALLLVYACLALQFMSPAVGLIACLPTFLQTALYFGALGISGVKLNATTSLVECLVLGLAVDDTIHYLARFNSAAKRRASESQGAVAALTAVLRPVTLTKAILALGFLMLTTGDLRNQVLFGWLAAFTLVAAWLVDVFVTPAFMSGVRVVTVWDSLLLNLGRDVQSTVPLFAGLTARQARVFALMSNLTSFPAGTRIITEGDPAGDIYVVIDGELSVWHERDGQRIAVATLRRGAVLGETGYFGQRRTAHVDALTPVRLLRFDDADQERICRRYSVIAARVFLNLNKLQAERYALTVEHAAGHA